MHALHDEAFVDGPLVAVGFPCDLGDETAFVGNRKPLPFPPHQWLSSLLRQPGPGMRTPWLMHEPPRGTPLTVRSGPVSGNQLWNEAIERFSPWLVISGHDHGTPVRMRKWHARFAHSLVVNVGQTAAGPLHHILIEGQFPMKSKSLPSALRITAYPDGRSLLLPDLSVEN
jgi:hypothetical protein